MAARVGMSLISASRSFNSRLAMKNILAHHLTGAYTKPFLIVQRPSQCFISTSAVQFSERKYSQKHEWLSLDGKIGTVGISEYAQESLGDVVYVQLPEIGSEYQQDEECGAVESVKAASEIYTPVSGKVTEVNKELEDKPALVNKSCYDEGWLFRIELTKPEECDGLMNEEKYKNYLKALE